MAININFFKTWSYDMAYILGFITADGNLLCKNYKDSSYSGFGYILRINIHKKDIEILNFIKSHISPSQNLYFINNMVSLVIGSKDLVYSLMDIGIYPNKTGKERMPDVPDQYTASYLRGVFDGDGSLMLLQQFCKSNQKTYGKYIYKIVSGGILYLKDINTNILTSHNLKVTKNDHTSFKLQTESKNKILDICNFMYKDNTFKLKRKYDKYLELTGGK